MNYPRMRADSADYGTGHAYSAELRQEGQELHITHHLVDANCLPAQWLRADLARLCCEIRMPQMLYSRRFVVEEALRIPERGPWKFLQIVELMAIPESGNQRLFFLPAIVLQGEQEQTLDSGQHGVSALWNGRRVSFPRGAILAGGEVQEDPLRIEHLLSFKSDDQVADGEMRGQVISDDDASWRYEVHVSAAMLKAIQGAQNSLWMRMLYTGCIAWMLVEIDRVYRGTEQQPAIIARLGEKIENEYGLTPPWKSDEGEWDALALATKLLPLRLPREDAE